MFPAFLGQQEAQAASTFSIHLGIVLQLFALINPLSSLPFMIGVHKSGVDVRRLSIRAVITAFIIAIIIAIVGRYLFEIFGITAHSFRIAGGLVLLLLALDTIRGSEEEYKATGTNVDSLIAILATPLLTGPATISFITIKSYEFSVFGILADICIAFLLVGIVFVIFCFSIPRINMKLVDIVSKIMGLFLMAMAVEMVAAGIEGFIKTAMGIK